MKNSTLTRSLIEPFWALRSHDCRGTNNYGSNSPLGVDEEFNYDFYVVDNWPLKYSGDGAVTAWNPGVGSHASPEGGLVKRVNLSSVSVDEKLTASIYTAATFTDPASYAMFSVQFFNASDSLLATQHSSKLRGSNYKWLILDRVAIPTGTTYVKLVPTVKLGANETSSMLWDEMRMTRHSVSQVNAFPSSATIGPDGGTLELSNFARLEIPPGALSENTVITIEKPAGLRQTLPGVGVYSLDNPAESAHDYASDVLKISPVGLNLAKPAKLFLSPDDTRLGDNHPASAPVSITESLSGGVSWEAGMTEIPKPGVVDWPEDLPSYISKLGFAARFIPKEISPGDGLVPFILNHTPDEPNFSTQNFDYNPYATPTPEPTVWGGDHPGQSQFITFRSKDIPFEFQKEAHNYLDKVHTYYSKLMEKAGSSSRPNPFKYYFYYDNGNLIGYKGIPVYLGTTTDTKPYYKTNLQVAANNGGLGASEIILNFVYDGTGAMPLSTAIEALGHELWHVFQYSNASVELFSPLAVLFKEWIYEGTAEYMGALAMNNVSFEGYDVTSLANGPVHYLGSVSENLDAMDVPLYDRPEDGYNTASFFTSLDYNYSRFNNLDKGVVIAKIAKGLHEDIWADPFNLMAGILGGKSWLKKAYENFSGQDEISKLMYSSLNRNGWIPREPIKMEETITYNPQSTSHVFSTQTGSVEPFSTKFYRIEFNNLNEDFEYRFTFQARPSWTNVSPQELNDGLDPEAYITGYTTYPYAPTVKNIGLSFDVNNGDWHHDMLPPQSHPGPHTYIPGVPTINTRGYFIAFPNGTSQSKDFTLEMKVKCEKLVNTSSTPPTQAWVGC